jgi:hypothetical protein
LSDHEKIVTIMVNRRPRECARIAMFFCWLVMIAPSSAQQPKAGLIMGHVVDSAGATVGGAAVFVHINSPRNDDLQLVAHTNARGDFVLQLPAGGYDVLVTSPSFAAGVETVPVSPGKTKKIQWKLSVLGCDFPGMNCDSVE